MGAIATGTSSLATPILAAMAGGATLLTPNQRAARTLHRGFELAQRAAGHTRWTPPSLFALDTWLKTLHYQLLLGGAETRILLNPTQEHALWRDLIAADHEVSGLRSEDSLAQLAAQAWRLLHLYGGRSRLNDFLHTTDTRAFQRWANQFDRLCHRELYLTQAQLPASLEAALGDGRLALPDPKLLLVDFDHHPPAIAALLTALGGPESVSTTRASSIHLQPTPDPASELRAAAGWARDLVAQSPGQTIAIVVPNLADRRPQINRSFAEQVAAGDFEFSLGRPLAETAHAASALDLLRWTLGPLALDRITSLLLSPTFAAKSPEPVAEFDAYDLRKADFLRPELSVDDVLDLLRRSPRKTHLGQLHARLRALHRAATTAPMSETAFYTHTHWSEAFAAILDAAGHTRSASLDSLSFQTQRRWQSALDTLATLDFNGARLTAAQAIQTLSRIATQTIFAPETRHAPIQILGPLELGGQSFDALWFLCADDRTWPGNAAANPLLPWQLQRALAMPGADPLRDQAHAESLTHRIAHSAARVLLSYATHSEDGPQRPSPLLSALEISSEQPRPEPLPTDALALEFILDTDPIPALPFATLRGGASTLALQSACAFRAFAERRLHSAELDQHEPGLDPADRGSLVHKVMQTFWDELQTQQALRELSPAQRHSFLDDCIDQALARTQRQIRTAWDEAYLAVQRTRLQQLLRPWLEAELGRPTFEVVATETKLADVSIGPLTLDLRVDRIDRTPAGTLILDYKTGTANPADWLSDRPDAPQLPLYAVVSDPTPGRCRFRDPARGRRPRPEGLRRQSGRLRQTHPQQAGPHLRSAARRLASHPRKPRPGLRARRRPGAAQGLPGHLPPMHPAHPLPARPHHAARVLRRRRGLPGLPGGLPPWLNSSSSPKPRKAAACPTPWPAPRRSTSRVPGSSKPPPARARPG